MGQERRADRAAGRQSGESRARTQSFCRRTAWKRNSDRRMRCGSNVTASTGGMPTSIKAPPGRRSDWPCSTQAGSPEHSKTRSSPCGSAWVIAATTSLCRGVQYGVGPAPPGDRKTFVQEIGHPRRARRSRFRAEQHREADRTGAEDRRSSCRRRSCESRTACRPIESGSTSMASSNDMESGIAAQQAAGAT